MAHPHTHLVELYRDESEIAGSVASFLADGLAAGEPAIAIAAESHAGPILDGLRSKGWDVAELERDGLLVSLSAERTLSGLLVDGTPSAERFDATVGTVIRAAAERAGAAPRAYGEMVDLLWERRDPDGALALEELWNELATSCDFTLLCGYKIDIFDRNVHSTFLPQVCRAHSRVVAGANAERIERAVNAALAETLGYLSVEKVYSFVEAQHPDDEVPRAQLALMWVNAHMPRTAERVLAAARAHYAGFATA